MLRSGGKEPSLQSDDSFTGNLFAATGAAGGKRHQPGFTELQLGNFFGEKDVVLRCVGKVSAL